GEDRLVDFQAIGWDTTAKKHAREEQERIERRMHTRKMDAIGTFAGGVAHNFNNLIHAVTGNLELAMEELPPDSRIIDDLAEAMRAARQAADTTGLIMTFLGQAPARREPVDLSDACRESLSALRSAMPEGVRISDNFPAPGPVVHANADQLRQILTHLATNAWEAAAPGRGDIRLSIGTVSSADIPGDRRFPRDWRPRGDAHARLEVVDHGRGIKPQDLDNIFDPFFTDKFTGRGLGLPVVLGVVKALDGGVTVESGMGRGSVFRVFLPLADEEAVRPEKKPMEAPRVEGRGVVLLVEDDAAVRKVGKTMLERLGFDVITAEDGAKAVKTFREEHADVRLVLSDLSMPRLNGWETLAALRKIRPDIPVILASGYDEEQVLQGARDEMPQAILHKPYRWGDLKIALGKALRGGKASDLK
ncbi:MAG: response regulator, partial [Desulfobacterales bacterium]|nr:response regulator [Desulfobacterales bacterium]